MNWPYRELPARFAFKVIIRVAGHDHKKWLEAGGLKGGECGPLDSLVLELKACLFLAEKLRDEAKRDSELTADIAGLLKGGDPFARI